MKKISITNLPKLLFSISAVLISISLLIFSLRTNSANARETKKFETKDHATGVHIVGAGKHIYQVEWNDGSNSYEVTPIYTDH